MIFKLCWRTPRAWAIYYEWQPGKPGIRQLDGIFTGVIVGRKKGPHRNIGWLTFKPWR